MSDHDPMTDERLAEIEGQHDGCEGYLDTKDLIAEVRRLRLLLDELNADVKQTAEEIVKYDQLQNARITVLTGERDEALARVAELERIVGQFAFPNQDPTPEMIADWIRRRGQLWTPRELGE